MDIICCLLLRTGSGSKGRQFFLEKDSSAAESKDFAKMIRCRKI